MSKESKSRDRWQQLYASAHDREASGDWCAGCGYFRVAHGGVHRQDCTACDEAN